MYLVDDLKCNLENALNAEQSDLALSCVDKLLSLDPNNSELLKLKMDVHERFELAPLSSGFLRKLCWYRSTDESCFNALAKDCIKQGEWRSALLPIAYSLSVNENDEANRLLEQVLGKLQVNDFKIYYLKTNRIGHLTFEPDSWLRKYQAKLSDNTLHLFVTNGDVCNLGFYHILQRHMDIIEYPFFHRLFSTRPQLLAERFYGVMPYDSMNTKREPFHDETNIGRLVDIYAKTNRVVDLNDEETAIAKTFLDRWGVPLTPNIVCLHTRDPVYLAEKSPQIDFSNHDFRDADIANYASSVRYLIEKGYQVVRIGGNTRFDLDIDSDSYINFMRDDSYEASLAELYLIRHCTFMLATSSGPATTAAVFDTPMIVVNCAPYHHVYFKNVQTRIIPKLLKYKGKYVNYIDILNGQCFAGEQGSVVLSCLDGNELSRNGYEYEENSSEDILAAVTEYEALLIDNRLTSDRTPLQEKYLENINQDCEKCILNPVLMDSFLRKHDCLFNLD